MRHTRPQGEAGKAPQRLHLLMATILTVNLVAVGVLVVRSSGQRPMLAAPASALHDAGLPTDAGHTGAATGGMPTYDPSATFAAPDQLPGDITAAPESGSGSGRPASFLPGAARGDGTVFAKYDVADDGAKVFKLDAAPYTWIVAPGVKKQAVAFNGTVPGPTIRVIQGDKVRVVVTNHMTEGTAVHWHGMVLPNKMDGVPGITQDPIEPGGSKTYEFVAVATGTHWYHSHWDGDQVGKGLYGSLEVVPHTGDRAVDRDYRLFIGDTNLGFVINGRTYPGTEPLKAKVGEKIRIRLTPTGELSHPFHLHGQPFQLVAQDGFDLPQPVTMDTLLISTAQTFDIITVALAPGRWMFHCHIFSHMHAAGPHAGHQMSGLVTTLDVEPSDVPAVPPLNGVTPAAGVPAAPVTPGSDNPPAGDPKDKKDGDKGGGAAPPGGGAPAPPGEAPHH